MLTNYSKSGRNLPVILGAADVKLSNDHCLFRWFRRTLQRSILRFWIISRRLSCLQVIYATKVLCGLLLASLRDRSLQSFWMLLPSLTLDIAAGSERISCLWQVVLSPYVKSLLTLTYRPGRLIAYPIKLSAWLPPKSVVVPCYRRLHWDFIDLEAGICCNTPVHGHCVSHRGSRYWSWRERGIMTSWWGDLTANSVSHLCWWLKDRLNYCSLVIRAWASHAVSFALVKTLLRHRLSRRSESTSKFARLN